MKVRPRRLVVSAAAALALLAGTAACGSDGGSKADSKTIDIGAVLALSGANASVSAYFQDGAEIAVKEFNKSKIAQGYTAKLHYYDDQSQVAKGPLGLRQLHTKFDVPVALVRNSSVTLADLPIAKQSNVLLFQAGAGSEALAGHDQLFNNAPSYGLYNDLVAPQAVKLYGTTATAIVSSDEYGDSILKEWTRAFGAAGGKIVKTIRINPAETSYKQPIIVAQSSKSDMVMFGGLVGDDQRKFLKDAQSVGLTDTNHVVIPAGAEVTDPTPEGNPDYVGTLLGYITPIGKVDENQKFLDLYHSYKGNKADDEPHSFVLGTYQAVWAAMLGYLDAAKANPGKEITGPMISKAVDAMGEIQPPSSAPFSYSKRHQVTSGLSVGALSKSGFEVLGSS